jgi:hypothetical protein
MGKDEEELEWFHKTFYDNLTIPTEKRTLKIVKKNLNTNICSYLETSGGKSYNLYLNVVHFFSASIN